jgi:hypothetical protein
LSGANEAIYQCRKDLAQSLDDGNDRRRSSYRRNIAHHRTRRAIRAFTGLIPKEYFRKRKTIR